MSSQPAIDAFDAECAVLVAVVERLTSRDVARPSNCSPWTLHELIVHIAESIVMPGDEIPIAAAHAAAGDAADYYRRPERSTVEYRNANVTRTVQRAGAVAPDEDGVLLREAWIRTSATFARHDPHQLMEAGGRALSVDAYLLTRLMSVAAHGVDVAITMSRPSFTTALALEALRPVLLDLLGGEPPDEWTDQDLLEIGTGRRQLTISDRARLGSLSSRFPLLS